jgi:hypothetical protein
MLHFLGWRQTHALKVGHWSFLHNVVSSKDHCHFYAKYVGHYDFFKVGNWHFYTKTVNVIFMTWTVKSTFWAYYLVSLFVHGKLFLSYCHIVASFLNLNLMQYTVVIGSYWQSLNISTCKLPTYNVHCLVYFLRFLLSPPPHRGLLMSKRLNT